MEKEEKQEELNLLNLFNLSGEEFKINDGDVKDVTEEVVTEISDKGVTEVEQEITQDDEPTKIEVKAKEPETQEQQNQTVDSEEFTEINSLVAELSDVLVAPDDKEYDASIDGIKQMIVDTKVAAKREAIVELQESLDEKGKLILNALIGGENSETIEDLMSQVDYKEVPLVDEEGEPIVANQVNLIADWMTLQGFESDEIEEKLADLQKANLIDKESRLAQKKLAQWQVADNEKKAVELQKANDARVAEAKKEAEEFKSKVVNLTEIAGFKLNKTEAAKLHEYITKPVKDGKAQFMLDDNEETRLLYAYLAMNKFNKDKLSTEIATKKTITLKKVISNFQDKNVRQSSVEANRDKDVSVSKINWNYGAI